MTVDSDYESWEGGKWGLTLNSTDHSDAFQFAKFTEALNEPIQFKLKVQGIDASNTDIDDGNIAELDFGGTKAFKGRIIDSETSSDLEINIEGMGMSYDLIRRTFTKNYTGSNTDTIVSEVVGSTMNVGTNTRLNSTNGTVDFRMDEEQKLVGLNRLAGQYGGEWWVDEDSNGNDQFNMDTKRGGGSSVKTFKVSGSDKNAEVAKKNTSAGEGGYDGVVVKGYGDGDDQIQASAGSTGDNDEVLEYTDKTIVSDRAAQDKADQLKTVHVDGNWTEITVIPGDPNEILEVGDVVTVESSDADISNTDFRIVERTYTIDFQGDIQAELVCNNRPATIYEGGVAEVREETKSQTRNMQGGPNTQSFKSAENAKSGVPAVTTFQLQDRHIKDAAGNIRVPDFLLDYDVDPYRKEYGGASYTGSDPQVQNSSASKQPAVINSSGGRIADINNSSGSDQPPVINASDTNSAPVKFSSASDGGSMSQVANDSTSTTTTLGDDGTVTLSDTVTSFNEAANKQWAFRFEADSADQGAEIQIEATIAGFRVYRATHFISDNGHFFVTVPVLADVGLSGTTAEVVYKNVSGNSISLDGTIEFTVFGEKTHSHNPGNYTADSHDHAAGNYDADNHNHAAGNYETTNHDHQAGSYDADNHPHGNGSYDIKSSDIDQISIGDNVSESGSVNATSVTIDIDKWDGSSWVNKHTINKSSLLETNLDISNGGTLPDSSGYWRVTIETDSSSPDLVKSNVRLKHPLKSKNA